MSEISFAQKENLNSFVNPVEFYGFIKKSGISQKRDDEKTEKYIQRKNSFRFNGLGINDRFTIKFKPSWIPEVCGTNVDADNEKIGFACNFKIIMRGIEVPITKRLETKNKYIGSNAFNHRVYVDEVKISQYVIVMNPDPERYTPGGRDIILSVQDIASNINSMKKDLDNIEILVDFDIIDPFISQVIDGKNPTINNPVDLTIVKNAIHVKPYKFVIKIERTKFRKEFELSPEMDKSNAFINGFNFAEIKN